MTLVTENAVRLRLDRIYRLTTGERLRTCSQRSRYFDEVGRYYTVDENNVVTQKNIDIEGLSRELSLLGDD